MPSILSDEDKQTVKRTVPKASNKIHAVAVAKLYVAYPDRRRWTYTGLQGAAVLANDLVGNTFWLKLVDISVGFITVKRRRISVLTESVAGKQRCHLGPGNLRQLRLQPGPCLLSHIRARGLPGWLVVLRREGGTDVHEEDAGS